MARGHKSTLDLLSQVPELDLSPIQRLVYVCYAAHVNRKTGLAWPGNRRISKWTALSPRSIQRARKHLVQVGLLREVETDWSSRAFMVLGPPGGQQAGGGDTRPPPRVSEANGDDTVAADSVRTAPKQGMNQKGTETEHCGAVYRRNPPSVPPQDDLSSLVEEGVARTWDTLVDYQGDRVSSKPTKAWTRAVSAAVEYLHPSEWGTVPGILGVLVEAAQESKHPEFARRLRGEGMPSGLDLSADPTKLFDLNLIEHRISCARQWFWSDDYPYQRPGDLEDEDVDE